MNTTRLEVLKKELEIIRTLRCISFDVKAKAVEYYSREITAIEVHGSNNPTMEVKQDGYRKALNI